MQTLYCPHCESKFGQPIEMEEVESRFSYSIYRCPRCLHMRKVTPHFFSMDEIEDISKSDLKSENEGKSSNVLKTAAKVAGVGLVGLAGLAVLSSLASSKKNDSDESDS